MTNFLSVSWAQQKMTHESFLNASNYGYCRAELKQKQIAMMGNQWFSTVYCCVVHFTRSFRNAVNRDLPGEKAIIFSFSKMGFVSGVNKTFFLQFSITQLRD